MCRAYENKFYESVTILKILRIHDVDNFKPRPVMTNAQINPLSMADSWDAVAGGYSEMANWIMTPFAKKALELVAINRNANVADVACGTGILTCLLANMCHSVHSVDFSDEMLVELRHRLNKREIQNVELNHGDGQNLQFQENSFDLAFSLFGLMFFPDRIKGFQELHRILKPNGLAVVSSWAPIEKSTLMQATSEAIKAAIPDAPSVRANSNTLENPELFKREMEAAGFYSVVIHECTLDLPEITPNMFWKLMSEGGAPIALLKKKFSHEQWEVINKNIINHLNSTYAHGMMKLATTSYFGVGRKK